MKIVQNYRQCLSAAFVIMLLTALAGLAPSALAQGKLAPDHEPTPPQMTAEEHGYLGVTLQDLTDADRQDLKYQGKGVLVGEVVEDSPAEEAGLKDDDVICRFNGYDVMGETALRELLAATKSGDKAEIQIFRKGEKKDYTITLGSSLDATSLMMGGRGSGMAGLGAALGGMQKPLRRMLMMEAGEECSTTWLGVELLGLSDQLRSYFKVKGDRGVLVSRVEDPSPAKQAGLKAGDVIVLVDNTDVFSREDVVKALYEKEPGDKVVVEVVRGGKDKIFNATVAERSGGCKCGKAAKSCEGCGMEGKGSHSKIEKRSFFESVESPPEPGPLDVDTEMQRLQESIDDLQQQMDQLRLDITKFGE